MRKLSRQAIARHFCALWRYNASHNIELTMEQTKALFDKSGRVTGIVFDWPNNAAIVTVDGDDIKVRISDVNEDDLTEAHALYGRSKAAEAG